MKIRSFFLLLLCAAGCLTAASGADSTAAPAAERPEFTVVIVESLRTPKTGFDAYERIARVFTEVFEARHWPVKITTERFAANAPAHALELRVFFQRVSEDSPGELNFRAWMTMEAHGQKHDFGVIRYRYYPRSSQDMDGRLDQVTRGAAQMAAERIERILFPAPAKNP